MKDNNNKTKQSKKSSGVCVCVGGGGGWGGVETNKQTETTKEGKKDETIFKSRHWYDAKCHQIMALAVGNPGWL